MDHCYPEQGGGLVAKSSALEPGCLCLTANFFWEGNTIFLCLSFLIGQAETVSELHLHCCDENYFV